MIPQTTYKCRDGSMVSFQWHNFSYASGMSHLLGEEGWGVIFADSTPHSHFAPNAVSIGTLTPTAEFCRAHNTTLSRVTSSLNPVKAMGSEGRNSAYDCTVSVLHCDGGCWESTLNLTRCVVY